MAFNFNFDVIDTTPLSLTSLGLSLKPQLSVYTIFQQFTTLTFTSNDNTLSTQHTVFISLSHFTVMKDPSSKRQLSVYTISTVHYLNFYFY